MNALNEIRKSLPKGRWEENDLMFPSTVGIPLSQHSLFKHFKETLKNNNLDDIRFHDLRHTAASLMLNHGILVIVVSKRLGHSKVSITMDIYGHLIPESQKDIGQIMDGLITPIEFRLNSGTVFAENYHFAKRKIDN